MRLTLDELKALVDIKRIDRRGDNAYGLCPSCQHDEFGISLKDNHVFGCFRKKACSFAGNIYTLLRFLGKQIIDVKPGFEPRSLLQGKLFIDKQELDLTLEDVRVPTGWKRVMSHPYLDSRGFTEREYNKFEVGVTSIDSRFKDMVIFKVPQNGTNKGYIARSIKSKKEIERINADYKEKGLPHKIKRYRNSDTTDFSRLLLGIEECTENTSTVIIVEGLFDKVNTDRVLKLEGEAIKCCASFKCGMSPEQIFLLQATTNIDTVILLYDPDVINEIKKVAWDLEKYFNVFVGFEENGKDPGDMNESDFDTVLEHLKTPSQFSVSKINVKQLRKK
jgi:5S rRNA maturation endonuclease (ribonuclease M5)